MANQLQHELQLNSTIYLLNLNKDKETALFHTLNGQRITPSKLVFYCIEVVVAVLILLLNGLVLDTMVRQGKSREPADLLVAGLALTDALIGVFILWVTIYTVVYFQTVSECLARLGLAHSMLITGMLHLLCLTVDRFLKIVTPYRYNDICEKWTVWVVMAAMWLLGILLGSLPTFGWNGRNKPKEPDDPPCNYFAIMHEDYLRLFMVVVMSIILAMILLYFKLFLVARKHAAAIAAMDVSRQETSTSISNSNNVQLKGRAPRHRISDHAWKYTKTVLLIVGVNTLSWFPMGLLVICSVTGALDSMSTARKGDFMLYTSTLVYLNSLLNPLLYAAKIPAIRYRFRSFFCACARTVKPAESNTTRTHDLSMVTSLA